MFTYRTSVLTDLWEQMDIPCGPEETLWSPQAKKLCEWWWREHQGQIPLKSCFDILEHFDATPDIFLVDVQSDGNFVTRIVGENARASVEAGRVGSIIRHDDERDHIKVLHMHYSLVVQQKIPFKCEGRALYHKSHQVMFEGLDCPLSLDGQTVSHIIGILTLRGLNEGLGKSPSTP